jgi:thymidine phosphorylase
MIAVPIVGAHGLTIPKTSSRAMTSLAGTDDTMEVAAIDCYRIARLYRFAGAPIDKGAGIDLRRRCGRAGRATLSHSCLLARRFSGGHS